MYLEANESGLENRINQECGLRQDVILQRTSKKSFLICQGSWLDHGGTGRNECCVLYRWLDNWRFIGHGRSRISVVPLNAIDESEEFQDLIVNLTRARALRENCGYGHGLPLTSTRLWKARHIRLIR